jgi:hypothetical protein
VESARRKIWPSEWAFELKATDSAIRSHSGGDEETQTREE